MEYGSENLWKKLHRRHSDGLGANRYGGSRSAGHGLGHEPKISQTAFKRTILIGSNYSALRQLNDAVEDGKFAGAGKQTGKLAANARALAGLWPKGSGGPATAARPLVWQNMDSFKAALAVLRKAADSAAAAKAEDFAALRKVAAKAKRSCNSCHKTYRTF